MAIEFRTENSGTIWLTADGVTRRMFVYSKEEKEVIENKGSVKVKYESL